MPSPKSKKPESALLTSAAALEAEVARWEALVGEAQRMEVSNEKTLQRAKTALEECAACEQTLATQLHAFVSAMQELQVRQKTCMEGTLDVAKRIQERVASRSELLEKFGALGQRAGEINGPVASVMEGIARAAPASELLGPLDQVASKTDEVVAEADALAQAARATEWIDIAKEADALKQQIQSVRNKVLVAHRNVAARAPS